MTLDSALLYGSFSLYLGCVFLYLGHALTKKPLLHKSALGLVIAAFALQTLCLGLRWNTAGYLPVTNLFSTLFFFSWSMAATYVYFELRYRIAATGLFVMLLNLVLLSIAMPRDPSFPPLYPALDTPLFTFHIAFSFLGYAFFSMAFSMGVLYLFQRLRPTALLPDLPTLRKLNEEAVFLGFCLFSLCMIFGSYWAYVAWGYYFSWNIKGIWSFLVWLFYGGMCHAKFVKRWQGTGYALLSLVGFGVVLFTYLGIGLLMSSNHPLD